MSWFASIGWLGVRVWIWFYFFFSIVAGIAIALYWKREDLKRILYQVRFPERVVKVIIHYKSGLYNVYWRLIPDKDFFKIVGKKYFYHDNLVLKENDFFVDKDKRKEEYIIVDGMKFSFNDVFNIKQKGEKWTEIHYFYNNPKPLSFDLSNETLEFSSQDMTDFEENDLFSKLLTLTQEKQTMIVLMVIVIINAIATFVILAKMMGWLK